MKIALAQVTPVWLNKAATLNKLLSYVDQAAKAGAKLVVFGEAIVPGYPFWLDATPASRFNDERQKQLHAHYLSEALLSTETVTDGIHKVAMPELAAWPANKKLPLYSEALSAPPEEAAILATVA